MGLAIPFLSVTSSIVHDIMTLQCDFRGKLPILEHHVTTLTLTLTLILTLTLTLILTLTLFLT